MSYRAEGRTEDDARRKLEQDIRYLYKCCDAPNEFEVCAAEGDYADTNYTTGRWFSRGGSATLIDVFISVTSQSSDPFGLDIIVNGSVVDTLVLPAFTSTADVALNPQPVIGPLDWLMFRPSNNYAFGPHVQARLRGAGCGSAGLNFVFVDPYTTEIC